MKREIRDRHSTHHLQLPLHTRIMREMRETDNRVVQNAFRQLKKSLKIGQIGRRQVGKANGPRIISQAMVKNESDININADGLLDIGIFGEK